MIGSERIRSENNCVPRDIVAGRRPAALFGYNVFIGLRTETQVSDVLSASTGFESTESRLRVSRRCPNGSRGRCNRGLAAFVTRFRASSTSYYKGPPS